ncbi:hypothetical protein BYT27DRAFT_6488498 [Phlegmacium glaucopus]|nr:hypothetical protein BYT27DRAFT_6488498 [Phlegmacium glaucopus]
MTTSARVKILHRPELTMKHSTRLILLILTTTCIGAGHARLSLTVSISPEYREVSKYRKEYGLKQDIDTGGFSP